MVTTISEPCSAEVRLFGLLRAKPGRETETRQYLFAMVEPSRHDRRPGDGCNREQT
jgi:hypothetical protein